MGILIGKPYKRDIEARFRSLLQKAVRRGNVELVLTASAYLENLVARERNWFRNRAAVITFQECWPLGAHLVFTKKYHSKVAALVQVTRMQKARDAAGLGALAHALVNGDPSVYEGTPDDRHIRIIANAIRRPEDFWKWLAQHISAGAPRELIDNALRFRNTGRPRDRAVLQAAAYLAATGEIPLVQAVDPNASGFPYWIAFDAHTPEGKRVLNDIARDLHLSYRQLEWSFFYFEGSVTNAAVTSKWWDWHCRWHFRKIGLSVDEAPLLWEPVKPQLQAALDEEARQLHRELYAWKLTHRDRIESLKKKVILFGEHRDSGGGRNQRELFASPD
jgi:hypothetical protein